jgi:hypothetical protein
MTAPSPELREGAVALAADDIRVRAGFRMVPGELLAGGPVELEFFVESLGLRPLRLAVTSDRTRQRPGGFSFAATFEDSPLEDPMAMAQYMGGPAGIVQVSSDSPWQQPLVLNQFLRLEHTPGRIPQGARGRMKLACRRPLALAATEAAALLPGDAPVVAVNLSFDLRRDDAALAALAARLFDAVMEGPPASRERPLVLLLSMRTAARPQIDALAHHPDPAVARRTQ